MQKEFLLFRPRKYLLTMLIGETRMEKKKDINLGSLNVIASNLKKEDLGVWHITTTADKGYVIVYREK